MSKCILFKIKIVEKDSSSSVTSLFTHWTGLCMFVVVPFLALVARARSRRSQTDCWEVTVTGPEEEEEEMVEGDEVLMVRRSTHLLLSNS